MKWDIIGFMVFWLIMKGNMYGWMRVLLVIMNRSIQSMLMIWSLGYFERKEYLKSVEIILGFIYIKCGFVRIRFLLFLLMNYDQVIMLCQFILSLFWVLDVGGIYGYF